MKKQLVASLAAAMVLGVAGSAFAASNPFVDVPAKHWAYDSVTKLAQAGIVDGYSDGKFQGDKVMSRYEMAQIVAKAMAKSDKADASQKAAIDKLAVEFASELEGLNVRMTKVEAKQDNVKWGGKVQTRYDSVSESNVDKGRTTNPSRAYVDMWATAQINPDWVGKVEYESSKKLTNSPSGLAGRDGGEANSSQIYAQGPLFGAKTTVGKFGVVGGYGIVIDDKVTGVQFEFGNLLKTKVTYGSYTGNINTSASVTSGTYVKADGTTGSKFAFGNNPTYAAIQLDYALSKVTNVKFAYHNLANTGNFVVDGVENATNGTAARYTELGFDTKFATDWSFMATAAKSNLDIAGQNNKSFFTELKYKAADVKKEGSYDIFANYRKIPVLSQLDSTWDYGPGVKGLAIGFNYVPATNIKLNAFYLSGKSIVDTSTENNVKIYRAQAEFFF